MTIKAYAINTVKSGTTTHPASVPGGKITVFDIEKDKFGRLEKLGAVRRATKEEIAQAKELSDALDGTDVLGVDADEGEGDQGATTTKPKRGAASKPTAPKSGAPNDPNGAPAGADQGGTQGGDQSGDLGV